MEMDKVPKKMKMDQDVSGIAQDKDKPVSCQLCEIDKIKWKCITCDYLMCERCCKGHKKIKSCHEHTIVDFKDIELYQGQSENVSNFKNINCQVHNGQNYCFFCTNCEIPVCPLCIEESHNDHPFKNINKSYEISVDKLKAFSSDIEKLTAGMNLKVELEAVGNVSKDKEKDKIRSQGEALVDAVNLLTAKCLDELDQRWDKQSKSIEDWMKHSKKRKEELETRNKYLKKVVQSGDPSTVFRVIKEENEINRQQIKSVNPKLSTVVEFIPGEINLSVIKELNGCLVDNDINMPTEIRFHVMKQYTTYLSSISNLKCDKESVWIYDKNNRALLNATVANGSLQIIRTINIDVDNMALLPTGDLLFLRKKLLTISHTTGKTEDFKCEQSLENIITGTALHVTKDNKIIVGGTCNRQSAVLVMDMTGCHETVYCHDINKLSRFYWVKNYSMFTNPIRVTSDSCHNVYVIDKHDYSGDRVVVLGQASEVRGIYCGCGKASDFKAVDLVATELDNIIVLDIYSVLHVIDSEGKCIKYQKLSDLGVKEAARSLDIDNKGMLLVGCAGRNNDAKIHVVKFSEI